LAQSYMAQAFLIRLVEMAVSGAFMGFKITTFTEFQLYFCADE
jgi:hypothetical protein